MKGKILAILFIFATCVLPALAAEKVKIGDLYYNLNPDNKTAEVSSENNRLRLTTANIPASIEYNSVIYNITSIGDYAFYDCRSLNSVKIPDSVTRIGKSAFCGCSSLTNIIIPNSVTYVGSGALWHCDKLIKPIYNIHFFIHLPRNFYGSYTIPDGIKSIVGKAFYDCCGLIDVNIPNSVTSIGDCAFMGFCSLNFIDIPNSVTNIEEDAFFECDKIKNPIYNKHCFAYLPPSYKEIYKKSVYTIPDGIEIVAGGAFRHCASMTSITIPNSVTSIGKNAFMGCKRLKMIKIPNSVTSIGESAFYECENLNTPIYNVHCFAYLPPSYKGAYIIPEGIKTIAGGAFYYCKELTSVKIPNSVTSIGKDAFCGCSGLTSINIPGSVASIGEFAFYGCSGLTSITIPNSITSIERYSFAGCSSLTSLTIPNNVTSIGENAFSTNLKELYYPQGLDISKADIPSSTKLVAYTPTNSSTTTASSSTSSSNTNVATNTTPQTTTTQPSTPTTKQVSTTSTIPISKPICTILYPSDENTYYSKSPISIRYKVENLSEGQTIEYYVDDPKRSVPIQGTKGVRIEQGAELKIEMQQYGKHVVGIRVVDAYGTRSEDTRNFEYKSVHKPTLHVFAVGVNKYKYKADGFKDLNYAVYDAKDFAKTIVNLADMEKYEKVDTTLLLDGAANRTNLEEQLIELIRRVQADDVVMLFFSGHGVNINGDSYFLTSDAKDPLRGLSFHFINQRIKDMKAKGGHILIFMDACHSGGMGNAKGSTSKSITLAKPGAIGYYSCSEDQTSIEKEELKNGVFTYALIEGMKGSKDRQQITMWGLYNIILEIVKEENKNQYPRLLHDEDIDNDYVIFYKKK